MLLHRFLCLLQLSCMGFSITDPAAVRITVNSPKKSIGEFPIFHSSDEVLLPAVGHWYIWLTSKETSLGQSDFQQISCEDTQSRILVTSAAFLMKNGSLNVCQQSVCCSQTAVFICNRAFSFGC